MILSRRDLGKYTGSGLLWLAAGFSALTMQGCNVFDSIMTWIPIGLTALQGIVIVLGPLIGPGAAAIIVLIKAAFADLSAAVSEYNADTNPADKATLLAKIRTFLGDIVAHFKDFLNALNLANNPIVAIVVGLAGVIISALMGFLGQLPTTAGAKAVSGAFTLGGKSYPVAPKFYKRVSDFKHDFNSVATTNGHPEISIK
jgi:hypothetical protein